MSASSYRMPRGAASPGARRTIPPRSERISAGVAALEPACRQLIAVELAPPAMIVEHEDRLRVGIPLGGRLAGKSQRDVVDVLRPRVEDQRLALATAVVKNEEPRIAPHRRPSDGLEALPRSVPKLGDRVPGEVEHAQSAVAAVAVLG